MKERSEAGSRLLVEMIPAIAHPRAEAMHEMESNSVANVTTTGIWLSQSQQRTIAPADGGLLPAGDNSSTLDQFIEFMKPAIAQLTAGQAQSVASETQLTAIQARMAAKIGGGPESYNESQCTSSIPVMAACDDDYDENEFDSGLAEFCVRTSRMITLRSDARRVTR